MRMHGVQKEYVELLLQTGIICSQLTFATNMLSWESLWSDDKKCHLCHFYFSRLLAIVQYI